MTVLLDTYQDWYCPACKLTDRTKGVAPAPGLFTTRMHTCPKLRGLTAPMMPAHVKAKLVLHEREDYVGKELVQLDPERGRPVMNMETVRDEGTDMRVYAPTAVASVKEYM